MLFFLVNKDVYIIEQANEKLF